MAAQTDSAALPQLAPQGPAPGVSQPQTNQMPPAPDPRDAAASSFMPQVPKPMSGTSSKLSTITAALGYNRFLPISFGTSTYRPSFILLSLVLSEIDRIMMNTHRFYQTSPEWHPLMSQLYYGIIFIVHILVTRRSASVITMDENNFLDWFETNFPLSSLPIAGPLKHFFQSITTTQGYSKFYGNVYPMLPTNWNLNAATRFHVQDAPSRAELPPVPLYMDMLLDLLQDRPGRAATATVTPRLAFNPNSVDDWRMYYLPLSHAHGAASDPAYIGMAGVQNLLQLPATVMPTWYLASQYFGYPERLTPTTTTSSIGEFLRLGINGTEHSIWFSRTIQVMQRHAQFLKDSSSLASISTVGLGACLPIIKVSANANLSLSNPGNATNVRRQPAVPANITGTAANAIASSPGRPAGYSWTKITDYKVSATSKFENLHLLSEQFALLSCINIDSSLLAAHDNQYYVRPTNAQLREGPIWTLPNVKSHTEINVLGQITSFLAGSFHADQRLKV